LSALHSRRRGTRLRIRLANGSATDVRDISGLAGACQIGTMKTVPLLVAGG
jgi:hypothetical protein